MVQICTQTWKELDGRLVFSLTVPQDMKTVSPAVVHIRYEGAAGAPVTIPLPGQERVDLGSLTFRDQAGKQLCEVSGTLQRQTYPHGEHGGHIGIWANLAFGRPPLSQVEGLLAWVPAGDAPEPPVPPPVPPVPPPEPPEPPAPPIPDEPSAGMTVVGAAHETLFPYVYMRSWPQPAPQVMTQCFVLYAVPADPPADSLYAQLQQAATPALRNQLAVQFIDGTAPFAAGQFVRDAGEAGSMAGKLTGVRPRLDAWLAGGDHATEVLRKQLVELFGVPDVAGLQQLLATPAFAGDVDRLWQSYFALTIVPGYQQAWLASLADMLVAQHVLTYLFPPVPANEPLQPVLPAVTAALVRHLRDASVVLPAAVSPLPADPAPASGIAPYAIGDLHLVRQRLAGYQLGEVAHVENVMRGERREIGRRRLQRQEDSRTSETSSEEALETQSASARHNLYEELCATVAEQSVTNSYDNFNTSYGPPTQATLSGSWTEQTVGGAPGTEDAVRFAQDLLNSTVGRIRRTVSQARGSSTLQQSEETVSSVIDNAAGDAAVTAVYHWVNKVYETDVVNYGKRLLVEFLLPAPAADFIREQQRIDGRSFAQPQTPAQAGIASFRAIEPATYAELAAQYDATDIEPPPQAVRLVSAAVRSGDEALVPLPAGYRATGAQVSSIAGAATPVVLVGTERYDGSTEPATRTFGQDSAMPVSVSAVAPPAPTPATPQPAAPDALVNVTIECRPDDALMDDWRIRTHAAILRAYQRQLTRFLELADDRGAPYQPVRSPAANRAIERAALRRGCLRLLMTRRSDPGKAMVVDEADVGEPRYLQFFDGLFEWNEMSYRWYDAGGAAPDDGGAGEDARFALFLGAGLARVMLPVAPERVMALLYFLSTGIAWDGANRHAPLNGADMALAADLKEAGMQRTHAPERIGTSWNVVVPTTMQVLRDRLPLWEGEAS